MSLLLTSLPPELINGIVANIESPATLCNLARCSCQLNLCTIPHIYRSVLLYEDIRRRRYPKGQLRKFASMLLQRPDLAGHFRIFELHVAGARELGDFAGRYEEPERADDMPWAKATTASSLSNEDRIKCLDQFSHTHISNCDLLFSLLLCDVLKLEKPVLLQLGWYLDQNQSAPRLKDVN